MASITAPIADRVEQDRTRTGKRFYSQMYVQVIIAVVLGAALGYFKPDLAINLKPLGDTFIKAIRVVVTPIIFATVVVGIAKMGDIKRIANVGMKSLLYFEVASTLALLIGLMVGNFWKIGSGINADPATLDAKAVQGYATSAKGVTMLDFFTSIVPTSFLDPFVKGDLLPVIFLAVLLGFALIAAGKRGKAVVEFLDDGSAALFAMVRIIMYAAPIGAFGAMAFTIGRFGLGTLFNLGQLVAGVYIVSFLFVVLVLGGFLRLAGFSVWKVLGHFKDEWLFVFAATSAETMMPRSMEKLERMGCSKEVVGLVMPSGFSFNMDGTAIYMTMAVLFMAHATNTHLTFWHQIAILFVMLFTSKGAAGVTGGGFIALAATMPVVDALPIGALALLIGVDRFMAEIRAATNLVSNIIATLVVGRWVGAVDYAKAVRVLNGEVFDEPAGPDAAAPDATPGHLGRGLALAE